VQTTYLGPWQHRLPARSRSSTTSLFGAPIVAVRLLEAKSWFQEGNVIRLRESVP